MSVAMAKRDGIVPTCIECGGMGKMTSGSRIFAQRPDLHGLFFFVCACGARVGCHPGTAIPMGFPCGPATARARDKAHRAFDRIWRARVAAGQRQATARLRAYQWLADQLGMSRHDAHISRFDLATCLRVVEICRQARAA